MAGRIWEAAGGAFASDPQKLHHMRRTIRNLNKLLEVGLFPKASLG